VIANKKNKNIRDYTALQLNLPVDIYFCGTLHIDEYEEINPDVFKVMTDIPHYLCFISYILYLYIARKLNNICTFYWKLIGQLAIRLFV